MFVSTVSQLDQMSKDELWRVASNKKTAQSIRRAAIRNWLNKDEQEAVGMPQQIGAKDYLRMLHLYPEDQPA
jgi:hypothetical protein